jgi:hypothetical protein
MTTWMRKFQSWKECEEKSEVAFNDDLDLNSKLEKFFKCETESYFNSHTYYELCRTNLNPEDQFPLMPQNVIIIIISSILAFILI